MNVRIFLVLMSIYMYVSICHLTSGKVTIAAEYQMDGNSIAYAVADIVQVRVGRYMYAYNSHRKIGDTGHRVCRTESMYERSLWR